MIIASNSRDSDSVGTSLLFSPMSSTVTHTPTTQQDSSTVSRFTMDVHNSSHVSVPTTTPPMHEGSAALSSGVLALVIVLAMAGVLIVFFVIYLKATNKLDRVIPCRRGLTKRRASSSSSHRPLDLDEQDVGDPHDEDGGHRDGMPRTREGAMFTIDDFEPVQNDEYSRPSNEEYFYDEVFGKSMFEDEATNASMRQLYTANDQDDEMFDVDAILNSITATRANKTTSKRT